MSEVSIASSGRADSRSSRASCSGLSLLEFSVFIGSPLEGRCDPRADVSADCGSSRLPFYGKSVHYENQKWPDAADRLPTISVWMRVGPGCMKRVFKYQYCF